MSDVKRRPGRRELRSGKTPPDGTTIVLVFDAGVWRGKLCVPGREPVDAERVGGVFGVMKQLETKYRDILGASL